MVRMKRAIILITIVALAIACCFIGCSKSEQLVSTLTEKLSPAIEKAREAPMMRRKNPEMMQTRPKEAADGRCRR